MLHNSRAGIQKSRPVTSPSGGSGAYLVFQVLASSFLHLAYHCQIHLPPITPINRSSLCLENQESSMTYLSLKNKLMTKQFFFKLRLLTLRNFYNLTKSFYFPTTPNHESAVLVHYHIHYWRSTFYSLISLYHNSY